MCSLTFPFAQCRSPIRFRALHRCLAHLCLVRDLLRLDLRQLGVEGGPAALGPGHDSGAAVKQLQHEDTWILLGH